jgi:hypothetical protein
VKSFADGQQAMLVIGKPSLLAQDLMAGPSWQRVVYDAMDDFPAFFGGLSRVAMAAREEDRRPGDGCVGVQHALAATVVAPARRDAPGPQRPGARFGRGAVPALYRAGAGVRLRGNHRPMVRLGLGHPPGAQLRADDRAPDRAAPVRNRRSCRPTSSCIRRATIETRSSACSTSTSA